MDIFGEIEKNLSEGRTFVLATIVQTAGSSPRQAGAKMIVYPDGKIFGTIGGGNFEKLVIEDSLKLFPEKKQTELKKYTFAQQGPTATGMCCGGEARVYMELHDKPKKLVIFGGGHVGKDIAKLAGDLDFKITVIDDRQEILDGYGPEIETVLTDDSYLENFPSLDTHSYVVIVSRSHQCDRVIIEKALSYECAYIGMIGSQKKVSKMFESLKEAGVSGDLIAKVRAPIGLDIGAEGPFEIAVSIVAELIAVKRNKLSENY